jgi:hypothetical protein
MLIQKHNFPFKASTLFRISNMIVHIHGPAIPTPRDYRTDVYREKKAGGLTRNNSQYTDKFSDFRLVKM